MNNSWIREVVQRDEVESTSDLARALVADPAAVLPLLVTARRQTRGRGRGANAWFSGDGSLMFTVALDPAAHRLDPALEPAVALAAALAVIDAARALGGPAQLAIRWPNDVEIDGRKLAGILPERVDTPRGPRLLIGVGVNLATRFEHAPTDVQRRAVALDECAKSKLEDDAPARCLTLILDALPRLLDALADRDQTLLERLRSLDALRDQPVRVDLGARILAGVGAGFDDLGALLLRDRDGNLATVRGGVVLRDRA